MYTKAIQRLALSIPFLFALPFNSVAAMNTPDIKMNANPRMRYEISVSFKDAPHGFDAVSAHVDYQVSNRACVPMTPVAGVTVPPSKRVPVQLKPVGPTQYVGEIYADLIQDEDYYGKGVCHWTVTGAAVEASVKRLRFAAVLFGADLFQQKEVTRYYANRAFDEADHAIVTDGNSDRNRFEQPDQTFSITVRAVEKAQ